jgi:TolB-like protein
MTSLSLILQLFILAPVVPPKPAPVLAPKTVAVLNFDNNSGRSDYQNVGKALAAMMITDLAAVPDLTLVERERMQEILTEQSMQHSALFDSTTAVKAGKLIGAQFIVTGAFIDAQPSIRIDTRVIDVQTGQIVKAAKVTGKEDKFFELQQKLAHELVDGLGVTLTPEGRESLRKRQEADRMDELATVTQYSMALGAFDGGDYVTAAEKLGPVMQKSGGAMVVQLTYAEAKKRVAAKAQNAAKDKLKSGLRGLIKKP